VNHGPDKEDVKGKPERTSTATPKRQNSINPSKLSQPKTRAQQNGKNHSHLKGHTMANPFVHMELCTPDVAKAKEFYTGLFNWTITDNDMGGGMVYRMFKPDNGPGGGIFTMADCPPAWLPYVGVEDINEATTKATGLGATVLRGPTEVPGAGWMTILTDPTGAHIALWQQKPA
jgi:predicted enzyme related to lactoylglutathione lyase